MNPSEKVPGGGGEPRGPRGFLWGGGARHARVLRERRDREPVPRGDHLVVPGRLRPAGAGLEQRPPYLRPACLDLWSGVVDVARQPEHAGAVLEGPGLSHTEQVGREVAAVIPEHLAQLRRSPDVGGALRSEEHTSELQSRENLVCRLLLEKKKRTSRRNRRRPAKTTMT